VSFAAITLCVASVRAFITGGGNFVIDSVRKLLDTPSYMLSSLECTFQILVYRYHSLVDYLGFYDAVPTTEVR
jgi:hypothetical protein